MSTGRVAWATRKPLASRDSNRSPIHLRQWLPAEHSWGKRCWTWRSEARKAPPGQRSTGNRGRGPAHAHPVVEQGAYVLEQQQGHHETGLDRQPIRGLVEISELHVDPVPVHLLGEPNQLVLHDGSLVEPRAEQVVRCIPFRRSRSHRCLPRYDQGIRNRPNRELKGQKNPLGCSGQIDVSYRRIWAGGLSIWKVWSNAIGAGRFPVLAGPKVSRSQGDLTAIDQGVLARFVANSSKAWRGPKLYGEGAVRGGH